MAPLVAQLSLLAAAAALAFAAASDLRRLLIPDTCSVLLLAAFAAYALTGAAGDAWPWHLVVGLAAFFAGTGLFAAGLLGGGDVKLFAAAGVWAGPQDIALLTLVMALSGGVLVLVVLARCLVLRAMAPAGAELPSLRGQPVPYGLAIAAGGFAVLAAQAGLF
jgi:prepilin peptidase CpaA